MQASEAQQAVVAAMSTASALDLVVDDAVVLNDSNRLVLRLLPCDVVARVAPIAYQDIGVYSQWADYQARAEAEVELVRRLGETDSPVAGLDPRVFFLAWNECFVVMRDPEGNEFCVCG